MHQFTYMAKSLRHSYLLPKEEKLASGYTVINRQRKTRQNPNIPSSDNCKIHLRTLPLDKGRGLLNDKSLL